MITNILPLINGKRYDWCSIDVQIAGFPVQHLTAIEYGEEQEKEPDYGACHGSLGTVSGRIKASAKITIATEVVQQLRMAAAAYGGRIFQLPPFLIVVVYKPKLGLPLVTHKLLGCEFLKDEVKWTDGDKKLNQELDLMVNRIIWI